MNDNKSVVKMLRTYDLIENVQSITQVFNIIIGVNDYCPLSNV